METHDIIRSPWSTLKKVAFRFLTIYFLVYMLPMPGANQIIPWVGEHILGFGEVSVKGSGSGDRLFDFVQLFVMLSIAVLGALIWTLADRKRLHYRELFYWLTVLIRYYLAFYMFVYGFAKVFKAQFPFPPLIRLLEPYGDSSPMGLVWTFMGYSLAYNIFTGMGEVIGGVLCFFRRTTTLGAMVIIGVMSNVVMLNFFYDVPVKLFSVHLVLLAVFLLAQDAGRLWNFFIMNRPTEPRDYTPFFGGRQQRIGRRILKVVIIVGPLIYGVWQGFTIQKKYGDFSPLPPLYGIYEVETFVVNDDTIPPLLTDTLRWQKLVFDKHNWTHVIKMDDGKVRFTPELDTSQHHLVLVHAKDTSIKYDFSYEQPAEDSLILSGVLAGDSLVLYMKEFPRDSFLLIRRGFQWVNEFPFNR